MKRFESLIRNLEIILVAVNGGDAKKLIEQYQRGEDASEIDPLDDDNVW